MKRLSGFLRLAIPGILAFAVSHAGFVEDAAPAQDPQRATTEPRIKGHSEWTRAYYPKRLAEFKACTLETGAVVFLGDSITEMGEDWNRFFETSGIRNRGIKGDTTYGVLARLEEIITAKPEQVFLMIGVNDIFSGTISIDETVATTGEIAGSILKTSPETEVYLQSILPTRDPERNQVVIEVNRRLRSLADELDVPFVNLHPDFLDEHNMMNPALTTDGVHINEAGYRLWADIIRQLIETAG